MGHGAVGPAVVVFVDEGIELGFVARRGWRALGCWVRKRFEGLVEALDLPTGGGVIGGGVDLGDSQAAQFVLQSVAPAPCRRNRRVVKTMPLSVRGRGRNPVCITGFAKFGEHDGAGDAAVGGDREGRSGAWVVEPVEDLDMGVIGEPPVGEVGLPAFVRLLGGRRRM